MQTWPVICILVTLLFNNSHLHAMDKPCQKSDCFYVRHLTKFFPDPVMLVGGASKEPGKKSIKSRTSLHWSLLGVEPKMSIQTINNTDGTETWTPSSLQTAQTKYGIIESLEELAPKVIGGEIFDIFTFGTHIPSTKAFLFVPSDEKEDLLKKNNHICTIVTYDFNQKSVNEAIDEFIKDNDLKYIRLAKAALQWSKNPWSLPQDMSFLDKLLAVDPELTRSASLSEKQLWDEDEPEFYCAHTTLNSGGHNCTLCLLNFKTKKDQYLALWTEGSKDTNFYMLRLFCSYLAQIDYFDVLLFINNREVISFKELFKSLGITTKLCNISHQMSGLVDLETQIRKTPSLIVKKLGFKTLSEIHALLKEEFYIVLEQGLSKLPDEFKGSISDFFCSAHEEIIADFLATLKKPS